MKNDTLKASANFILYVLEREQALDALHRLSRLRRLNVNHAQSPSRKESPFANWLRSWTFAPRNF